MKLISMQQCEAVSGGNYLIIFTTLTGLAGGFGLGAEFAWCLDRSISSLSLPVAMGTFGGISGALLGTGVTGVYHLVVYVALEMLTLQ